MNQSKPDTERSEGDEHDPVSSPDGKQSNRLRNWLLAMLLACVCYGIGLAWFARQVSLMHPPADNFNADAIIVLTGGQFRLDVAVDLLKAGKGKRLLISGVNPVTSRGDLQEATGADESLFVCCVDFDHAALDTRGNAEQSAKWIREHGYRKIILVTNNYHMPRSLVEMRRLSGRTELVPYPVVFADLKTREWLFTPAAARVLFQEFNKYLAALIRDIVTW